MIIIATIFAFALGIVGWIYVALKPPSPKICGTPNGPQVTSPRVKLNDGRHLAYKEFGVPKEKAQYKIILSHGYNASKDMHIAVSQEFMEEVKAYMVIYDRAGYGESDPYPSRSVKTEAFDIEELADKLKLGSKFYVIGCSLGAYPIWGCLKYIPHRLLGASLVVPFVNYWWPSIPSTLSIQSFWKLPLCFKFTFGIAHYTPWLYYWWTKQKWYRSTGIEVLFTNSDLEILKDVVNCPTNFKEKIRQQGDYECLHRDVLVSFGKWEFDPTELTNPSTESIRSVHMWQGGADRVIPIEFSRFVAQKLPWIQYHEVPNAGHLIVHEGESLKAIIRALIAE
ncbi:uncharacterized protein LOC103500177 isoform X2 [Cucumis melo]|uniref:Uncharacterized protein LOC103500177 isoform X2 n=1 Tax=Cucumis melo TaxID=3656 RepID=A0A1S4E478_CUCME|nr:uncharacterized protein LOC103500177 isoform X2 [Cucumis melo]XP_050935973.1 uncharacterized protein LOC103500177 isoform X2 [Cucumis melo]